MLEPDLLQYEHTNVLSGELTERDAHEAKAHLNQRSIGLRRLWR
jgi:hypothetical protein